MKILFLVAGARPNFMKIDPIVREGKPKERIHFVGHVMIDNLRRTLSGR